MKNTIPADKTNVSVFSTSDVFDVGKSFSFQSILSLEKANKSTITCKISKDVCSGYHSKNIKNRQLMHINYHFWHLAWAVV